MDISKGINAKIEKKDTKAILSLFYLNNKTATKNLNNILFGNLIKPFDSLLYAQKVFNDQSSITNSEKVLLTFKEFLMKEEWCNEIFVRIVYNLFVVGFTNNNKNENVEHVNNTKQNECERSAKILQSLFKEVFDDKTNHTKQKTVSTIFNFLICTYDKLCNYKMIDNLFSVFDTKIEFVNIKDKKIYNFMLGQHYIRKGDYKNAFFLLNIHIT